MAYKDPDKQRQASKQAMRRHRAKQGITSEGITQRGITSGNVIPEQGTLTPEGIKPQVPANYGQPNCECMHCKANRARGNKYVLNHGAHKTVEELGSNELNRVSVPGDIDYTPNQSKPDSSGATSTDPAVQAIWDRRNAQGQACFDGRPAKTGGVGRPDSG